MRLALKFFSRQANSTGRPFCISTFSEPKMPELTPAGETPPREDPVSCPDCQTVDSEKTPSPALNCRPLVALTVYSGSPTHRAPPSPFFSGRSSPSSPGPASPSRLVHPLSPRFRSQRAFFPATPHSRSDPAGFVVEPNPEEVRERKIVFQYCCSTDAYLRPVEQSNLGKDMAQGISDAASTGVKRAKESPLDGQTDRQTNGKADRQDNTQENGHADRQTD